MKVTSETESVVGRLGHLRKVLKVPVIPGKNLTSAEELFPSVSSHQSSEITGSGGKIKIALGASKRSLKSSAEYQSSARVEGED